MTSWEVAVGKKTLTSHATVGLLFFLTSVNLVSFLFQVRALLLQAVRNRFRHGQTATAGGLPLLHALRHLRPHHHLLINVLPQDSCQRTLYWQMLTFI